MDKLPIDKVECYALITALRAEVAALKAELARFTEPLTDEQARAVLLVESTRPNHSAEEIVKQWDDDIREVRKGKKDANSL